MSANERPEEVVDFDAALSRVAGDEAMLAELAEIYLEESPGWLDEIEESIAQDDPEGVFRAAHDVKGSTEVFRAESAVQTAKQLEKMGNEGDLEDADEVFGALKAELVWVRNALEDFLDKQ